MKTIAPDTGVEKSLGNRQVRSYLRHCAVKGIVEAGKVSRRWENRLRGRDRKTELEGCARARNVLRPVNLLQELRRNALMGN